MNVVICRSPLNRRGARNARNDDLLARGLVGRTCVLTGPYDSIVNSRIALYEIVGANPVGEGSYRYCITTRASDIIRMLLKFSPDVIAAAYMQAASEEKELDLGSDAVLPPVIAALAKGAIGARNSRIPKY